MSTDNNVNPVNGPQTLDTVSIPSAADKAKKDRIVKEQARQDTELAKIIPMHTDGFVPQATGMREERILIAGLQAHPRNPRRHPQAYAISMWGDFKAYGGQIPGKKPVIWLQTDGTPLILRGHVRKAGLDYGSMKEPELFKKFFPDGKILCDVYPFEALTAEEAFAILSDHNAPGDRPLTLLERAWQIRDLRRENPKLTDTQIAEIVGAAFGTGSRNPVQVADRVFRLPRFVEAYMEEALAQPQTVGNPEPVPTTIVNRLYTHLVEREKAYEKEHGAKSAPKWGRDENIPPALLKEWEDFKSTGKIDPTPNAIKPPTKAEMEGFVGTIKNDIGLPALTRVADVFAGQYRAACKIAGTEVTEEKELLAAGKEIVDTIESLTSQVAKLTARVGELEGLLEIKDKEVHELKKSTRGANQPAKSGKHR